MIDDLRAAFEGATLTASGQVPADLFRDRLPARWRDLVPQTGGPANLTAQLSSVTEQAAAPFVDAATLESIPGRVDGAIDLHADGASLDRVGRNRRPEPRRSFAVGCVVRSADADPAARARRPRRRRRLELGTGENRVIVTGGVSLDNDHARPHGENRARPGFSTRSPVPDALPAVDGDVRISAFAAPTVDGYLTFAQGELR